MFLYILVDRAAKSVIIHSCADERVVEADWEILNNLHVAGKYRQVASLAAMEP